MSAWIWGNRLKWLDRGQRSRSLPPNKYLVATQLRQVTDQLWFFSFGHVTQSNANHLLPYAGDLLVRECLDCSGHKPDRWGQSRMISNVTLYVCFCERSGPWLRISLSNTWTCVWPWWTEQLVPSSNYKAVERMTADRYVSVGQEHPLSRTVLWRVKR